MDDLTRLSNLFGALALAASDEMERALKGVVAASGQTSAALVCLDLYPPGNVGDLARRLELAHSSTVRLVDRLESEKWLVKEAGKGPDLRHLTLRLTKQGHLHVKQLLHVRNEVLSAMLVSIPVERRQELTRIFEQILWHYTRDKQHSERICRLCDGSVCDINHCPVNRKGAGLSLENE